MLSWCVKVWRVDQCQPLWGPTHQRYTVFICVYIFLSSASSANPHIVSEHSHANKYFCENWVCKDCGFVSQLCLPNNSLAVGDAKPKQNIRSPIAHPKQLSHRNETIRNHNYKFQSKMTISNLLNSAPHPSLHWRTLRSNEHPTDPQKGTRTTTQNTPKQKKPKTSKTPKRKAPPPQKKKKKKKTLAPLGIGPGSWLFCCPVACTFGLLGLPFGHGALGA